MMLLVAAWSSLVMLAAACRLPGEGCSDAIECCEDLFCEKVDAVFGFCQVENPPYGRTTQPPSIPDTPTKQPTTMVSSGCITGSGTSCTHDNYRENRSYPIVELYDPANYPSLPFDANYGGYPYSPYGGISPLSPPFAFSGSPVGTNMMPGGMPNNPNQWCEPKFTPLYSDPNLFEPNIWPNAKIRGIPYRLVYDNTVNANTRFVNSAKRAIEAIDTAMGGCVKFREADANEAFPVLNINIFQDFCTYQSCSMGAPYSEQLGLNPDEKSDNGIYINTVPFDEPQHERPDWLLEVVFIHEILHGVFDIRHEHTRADRDQYMKLFSSNLMCNNPMDPNNNLHYFEKNDPTAPHFSSDMKMPYDPRSIMHSGFDDYSRRVDGTPLTTVQLQPGMPLFWVAGPIRETPRLRFFDVEKMRTRYKCPRQNRELLKETRETYFLFKWIVDCEGDPYQLENYLSPAELTNRNMIEKCARLAENYGVLATLNLTGKSCNVHDSLANCQYKPHSSGDVAIIGRSNRLLRTFDKKVIVQAGSKPVSQISGALLRDLLSGECQALCQLMPGICVAATEINKGNTHQCQLYSQWPTRFTNTMDPAVTTYVVEDWDRMPIDDYNSLA